MTAATWSTDDHSLERHYRKLLLAYPGRYRQRYGTEMITTLLEMASPGQRRPRPGEALHLLASGVRHRLRLPARRPLAVIAAVLLALTMGAFGGAAGSWAGSQTFADLPDDATIASLAQRASGAASDSIQLRVASPWLEESISTTTEVDGAWDAEKARQRFAADGWSVSGITPLGGKAVAFNSDTKSFVDLPMRNSTFSAKSNGLTLQVRGYLTADHGSVHLDGWAQSRPMFLPLIVTGILIGLVVGWLFAAALAYRIVEASAERRRASAGLWAVALAALALPAVALYGNVLRAFRDHGDVGPVFTVHSAFTPGSYYPLGPAWQILALTIAGAVLAGAAIRLARPDSQPKTQEAAIAS
ncbi:hypothetical protein AB0J94_25100 [Micromonospora noduli]|uniref:hypothetical protein n=1 Tax=Micromonospora noduli TaxID=709876 RepID=UPI000DBFC299|nr:hypothetical protein [Micromonospora noduli]KAB1919231.1 DotU family type IV/VI secretion system protein [Micromonospora noduli]RAO01778.1 hypothetical protein GUI43_05570 [Micromonospora noduli]RAO32773.1 hypothetical protein ONO23_03192 [Micromonospora noduli]